MTTIKQIADIILLIAVEFPKDINLSKSLFDMKVKLWHDELKSYDYKTVEYAVKKALNTLHFCPKLADVLDIIVNLENACRPSAPELWARIESSLKAAAKLSSEFNYTFCGQGEESRRQARKLYFDLPDIVKGFFGNYDCFMGIAVLDDLQFEKARFLRDFDRLSERKALQEAVETNGLLHLDKEEQCNDFKSINDIIPCLQIQQTQDKEED